MIGGLLRRGGRVRASSRWLRVRVLVGAAVLVLVGGGCRVETVVTVDVDEDGSGTVEVAVGLDEEALAEVPDLDDSGAGDLPDLAQLVRVDDLTASGWTVAEPSTDRSGVTWFRVSKPFGTPAEAGEVLAELTGSSGLLSDLQVARSSSFGRDRYEFSGTADLSGGLEALGDEGLAAALDGEPLGEDVALIEERLGRPVSEMLTVHVEVRLPGGDVKTFSPELGGDSVDMSASTTLYDWRVLLLLVVAAVCAVALIAVLAWQVWRARGMPG